MQVGDRDEMDRRQWDERVSEGGKGAREGIKLSRADQSIEE